MPTPSTDSPAGKPPSSGKNSIHRDLLEKNIPAWLINAVPARREAMKQVSAQLPDWYQRASSEQKRTLNRHLSASVAAQTRLDKTMSALQDIDTFASPLLVAALKEQFGVEVDVNTTLLSLVRPFKVSDLQIEISSFEVLKLPLLQAALHNFEASECEEGAYHSHSGFVVESSTPGTFDTVTLDMTVSQFLSLCRTLDIGAQYQTHVQAFFQPDDRQKERALREQFVGSQKKAMRAAAELALLKNDIEPDDYAMILSVIEGEVHPTLRGKPVWFRDLSLMKRRMTGCVVFSISEKYRYTSDFIVYVPHDPEHPLKRYSSAQLRAEFKRQFTARNDLPDEDAKPTAHQRFFSQFVAYADRPYYFSQFTRKAADASADPLQSIWVKVAQYVPPLSNIVSIKELPPERPFRHEPVDDPYLDPFGTVRAGVDGIWSANTDLWAYLYEQSRAKVIADARSHAAPTADVDARVRAEKLNHLLQIGMFGLNIVSMFVPVLGEVMMAVMAGQLLYESFEGVIEWSEGDRMAAKGHLLDVAENLALIGVMAGAGKGLARFNAVRPVAMIEGLEPVKRADGKTRLWKRQLSGYECDVVLGEPDSQGIHHKGDNTYIRLGDKAYETLFDPALNKWRISHPSDPDAWQPILEHNGQGAWRHSLERPLTWDRTTLLRRMGHLTEGVPDEQLLNAADACGVNDNELRKMHLDHQPMPPELAEVLNLFKADEDVAPPARVSSGADLVGKLQQACPGLAEPAARRILLDASAEELTRLKSSHLIPLKMLEEGRWYARQGRQARAFAGLHGQGALTADSRRLALSALEKLPGWSERMRVEMRDGGVEGTLIDSVDDGVSEQRESAVQQGTAVEGVNEQGAPAEPLPASENSFFDVIMHALSVESRRALGVPQVSQGAALRQKVIHIAIEHRAELMQQLEGLSGPRKSFKAPARIAERKLGYYASGRGQGLSPSLVARVQDVYPALSDQQANGFILEQLRAGKTDAQIFHDLQTRLREWQTLEATLDQWVGEPASDPLLQSMLGGKGSAADALKQCWRNSPLAAQDSRLGSLYLSCDDPLPALSTDFSHVRDLYVRGRCITDANADALLSTFPNLKSLRINATGSQFTNVPKALSGMKHLTLLSLYSAAPYAVDMPVRLGALTALEELNIYSSDYSVINLDVSRLRKLRALEVIAPSLMAWPEGVLDLPNLERLDLKGTGIRTLPDGLFEGHQKLWSGLSLDWSQCSRVNFRRAYEFVKRQPGHLVDLDEMVRGYCKGELQRLREGSHDPFDAVFIQFCEQWSSTDARFEAVEALSEQQHKLDQALNDWAHRALQKPLLMNEVVGRTWGASSLRACWRSGAFKRYGSIEEASTLQLPNLDLSEFPDLPAGTFPEVHTLNLRGSKASAEQVRAFVKGFTELHSINLSGSELSEIPIAPGDLSQLMHVDLSNNRIVVDAGVQQAVEGLRALESLDLSGNPLNTLNVSGMTSLRALNLRATNLQHWPVGAEHLPALEWLDLRDSDVTALPDQFADEFLLKVDLNGAPLKPQALETIKLARQRLERANGLPPGAMERFAQVPAPRSFPPDESGFSISRQWLPLSDIPVGTGEALQIKRLQRLKPYLADMEAGRFLEQMRISGATPEQINARLAAWEQTFETLTRSLNGWLFTRGSSEPGWMISSATRRLGALKILDCWREGIGAEPAVAQTALSLDGLQLGDLPELPKDFDHVVRLNLTSVKLSVSGSDGFLSAFTRLQTLELSGNELDAVPEPVEHMHHLLRLELSSNRLADTERLYASLSNLDQLRWLGLGYNDLNTFDASAFDALETLDLRNNNLAQWPDGTLDSSALITLNLSGNDLTSIPEQALDGTHDALMAGVDLTDNYSLSRDTLYQLRAYRESGLRDTVLGFSRVELDELIEDADGFGEGSGESLESDEVLVDTDSTPEHLVPWLSDALPEEVAGKTATWNQLAEEPDNAAFFHLLARLQDTREFSVAKADLTRRVWTVVEAAASNAELRELLFAGATTHGTCVDGRILTFSELESRVFTHNAVLDLPAGPPGIKAEALLKLSRQLFRLDRVDEQATRRAALDGQDEAEVRLGYRIGLTDGWEDGLTLPGQPKHMTYASGVTAQQLAQARTEIIKAEASEAFAESLIQRDYWVTYLKEKYPEVFRAFDEMDAQEADDVSVGADDPDFISQLFEQTARRNARLIELSRDEVAALSGEGPLPGPSTAQGQRAAQ